MDNNIIRKNLYNTIVNSYMKTPNASKIKGTLAEAEGNKIKLDIGGDKRLDITLKKPLDAKIGESVVIDRRDIVDSQLAKSTEIAAEDEYTISDSQSKYDYILKSFGIPVKEENLEAVEALDNHGVDITKENILSFISAKEQLSSIAEKLDYDKLIKLKDKNIDFEKESLQKVLQELEGVKGEKKSFSILKFLGIKKDMSTEEAEKIAYNLYGSKMGKDVTDIIKALDKAKVEITKDNIDNVNRIFHKLHNIKDIEDKTIIDSVKNKIEASIDSLYKLKNAITKGTVKIEEKLGQLANKAYGAYNSASVAITERDLLQIEGDIKARLDEMGVKVTEELVNVAKDVIYKGLDLTRENLDKVMAIKNSIEGLNTNLDYEKTAMLMTSGVDVEKVDVVQLMDMVNTIDNSQAEVINSGLDRLEILDLIDNVDIKTLALHMKLNLPVTLEGLNVSQSLIDGNITLEEWVIKLNALDENINMGEEISKLNIEDGFSNILKNISIEDLTNIIDNLTNMDKDSELDLIGQGYLKANGGKLGPILEEGYSREMAKALLQNGITLNTLNMQELYMLKKTLERVEDTITPNFIQNVLEEGTMVEKLPLNKMSNMLTSFIENEIKMEGNIGNNTGNTEEVINKIKNIEVMENMKDMVDTLKQISPERRDTIISLLMKNAMPLTLKEVQNLSFFLSNERQIGQQLNEILNLVDKNNNIEVNELAKSLKANIDKINNNIKAGINLGERPYEDFSKILRDIENKATFLSREERSSLQKSGEKLLDSLELQLHLNREDTLLQLPLMMGENLKNLQMYIMRDKKGSKKIDPKNMSILLNFDTNNMGNVNIYVAVNYRNIVMKMGLGSKEDQSLVESYKTELEAYLKELGYDLKELSFRLDSDSHILSMAEETEGRHRSLKGLLDVRI